MPELAKPGFGMRNWAFQFEVGRLAAAPDEERVGLRRIRGGRLADDGAVFNAPQLGIPVPAGQIFPVEKGFESIVGREDHLGQREHGEQNRGTKGDSHGCSSPETDREETSGRLNDVATHAARGSLLYHGKCIKRKSVHLRDRIHPQ